ncbi:protein of unknown function DUF3447 - like 10, partial [Theobroma cacao]
MASSSHQKSLQDESHLEAGQQQWSEITPASTSAAVEGADGFHSVKVEPRASGIKNPSRSLLLTLMKNIYSGDLASVNKFLNNYSFPLTTQLSTSGTALHAATIAGQPKIVELLTLAALHGNTEIAKCLFKSNKKLVTIVNSEGRTPVFIACIGGHKDTTPYLYFMTPIEFLLSQNG